MGNKILVIDDEPEILEMMQSRLSAEGYQVFTAQDGIAGVQQLYEEMPDLILLDVLMPRVDGFKVLEILRKYQTTQDVPIVMITAKGESKNILKAHNLKATDYLVKPFQAEELLNMVKRYI